MVTVKNPILPGFYPDPSICRVGEDFYLVTSSFVYAPGVPLFHSRDLAHWEQIGNILEREEQLTVEGEEISRGIYAPTIRYHNGVYYMITTNVSHGGNFIVTAEQPEGPWSDPYYLGEEARGIDPSLFFDDDGRCYYCGTRPNPEGVRYNGDWEIWVQELDLENKKLTGESMAIWKGAVRGAIWPEGPHLYKKDGYYYLLHAEGGTGPEHAVSVARSRELFQWFEGCPRNPVFTHRNLGADYPVVYASHGDLIKNTKRNWYIVMLATRRCRNHGSMGRETFLTRVVWEDGWPVIAAGCGRLERTLEVPTEEYRFPEEVGMCDTVCFWEKQPDARLLGIGKRSGAAYSLTERDGVFRLYCGKQTIREKNCSTYFGLRQKSYQFRAAVRFFFEPRSEYETAGMVLYQNHENHLRMEIGKKGAGYCFRVTACIHAKEEVIREVFLNEGQEPWEIQMLGENMEAQIWIGCAGESVCVCKEVSLFAYTTEEAGGFVGCTVGMYASSNGTDSGNYADYLSFTCSGEE